MLLKLGCAYESPENADFYSVGLGWDKTLLPGNADATSSCTTVWAAKTRKHNRGKHTERKKKDKFGCGTLKSTW